MCALMTSVPTTVTAGDGVADACAAMPCVLAPPPKPALDNLPMELITNIVKFIPSSPITPVRQLFWANYAPVLLEKIFSSFKVMEGLEEIHFGSRSSAHKPLPRSEPFIMSIGFDYAHTNLARWLFQRIYNREIGTYISAGHMRLLHRILSDTGFNKEIIHLNMRNLTGTERLSLPGLWPYLDHPSFQKLNFVDVDHAHPMDNIRAPSTMRLDPKNNATSLLTPMAQDTYWGSFEEISKYNVQLNYLEKMWMAWYQWMGNDVLATGIMSFVFHELFYFGRALPWIIIDCIPFFNRYKLQHQKIPTTWEQTQCAALVLLSHFTVELPQIWMFHPMCQYFGLQTSVPFPSIYKMAYQIAIFFVFEDAWHYWMHRAMHASSFLYKNIHKIHHQYSAPFGLAAEYASPIEVMILGFGTVGVPIVFCAITKDLHILTMYAWICLRVFQAIDAHSGYEFPWSLHHFLPFWAGAEHHDVHHEKFIGNYASSFRWWDLLFDTEAGAEASKKRRERKMAAAKLKKAN
ncbi:uncharacterized protein J4E79_002889 [Alternaria viburni]|uniref:uncharacterized protein n=1 Tax=Alternaria viburni TaxID=566460 RepID=UPI0020C23D3A|nr:uncharacterized protein J4E79_002889 [Alternaria viburni]KAI4664592.1 hypothetical protein J4E79_002889 [Alternaria viburni]